MRILIVGHEPWSPTAYGYLVKKMAQIFTRLGHQPYAMAIQAGRYAEMRYDYSKGDTLGDMTVFLVPGLGQEVIGHLVRTNNIDIVLSVFDAWVLKKPGYEVPAKWYAWVPVDQAPPALGLKEGTEAADEIISFSMWGQDVLQSYSKRYIKYIPLPVDDAFYHIGRTVSQKEAREFFGLEPWASVVGIVGSNLAPDRKALAEMILGFDQYNARYDANATLLVRTNPVGHVHIPAMAQQALMNPGALHTIDSASAMLNGFYTNNYRMGLFYRACDVLLHASVAEGFGLCMVEAMACGTPVIANNTTSMPEIIGQYGGIITEAVHKTFAPQGGIWHRPSVDGIARCLFEMLHPNGEIVLDPRRQAETYHESIIEDIWGDFLKGG